MRSKIARKICSMLPLVLLPPTLIVSCAQNSQFDIKIDRNNTKHLSFTNLSVTLTAKIFDKKSQMDMSDEQCCTWACHGKKPDYLKQIINDNVMTLVLSLDEKVPTSKLTFTASCGGASASAEVIIDEYDPPNYPNTINLTSDKVFLTQSQNTFTINASIDGRDSNGVVTFDNSQLPSFIETELHDNQLKLSLKNGSDTERGNFTIQVSFLDAATKVIVVETEDYEAWPADCIPQKYLDISGSTFNRIKKDTTPDQLSSYTTLKIPKQITKIGRWALGEDTNGAGNFKSYLSSNNTILDWGESKVTSIGYYSFIMAPFKGDLVLPNTLDTLEEGCFGSCGGFTSVDMSACKLTSVSKTAFMGCTKLQSIKFCNSIKTIGISAFSDCNSLVGDIVFPTELTSIGASAFVKNTAWIPDENNIYQDPINLIWNAKIKTLGENAFAGAKLKDFLIIPESVTTISQSCFVGTRIEKVQIPTSCKTIGQWAFHSCPELKEFEILSTTTFFPYRPDPKAGPDSSLTLLNDTPIDAVPPKTIDPNAKIIVPSTMYENYKKGNTAKGYEAWPSRLNIVSA